MTEIEIRHIINKLTGDTWDFIIHSDELYKNLLKKYRDHFCSICEQYVSPSYVYIINYLKKAGLLDKNYKYICCGCS